MGYAGSPDGHGYRDAAVAVTISAGFDQRHDPEVDAFKVRVSTVMVAHDHGPIRLKRG